MEIWEYLELAWFYERDQRRYAVNGQFKHEWNGQAFHQVLNQLGQDGWEMVAMNGQEVIFKRLAAGKG